jgi:hypothetical protein
MITANRAVSGRKQCQVIVRKAVAYMQKSVMGVVVPCATKNFMG